MRKTEAVASPLPGEEIAEMEEHEQMDGPRESGPGQLSEAASRGTESPVANAAAAAASEF